MNKIIDNLYLGSYYDACNLSKLQNLEITHIVNVSNLSNCYPLNFNYFKIDIDDDSEEDINKYFTKTSRFIHNAILKGSNVLVHCVAGKSRSPTLIIAYLIQKKHMTLENAIKLVKEKRTIDMNDGFKQQLIKRFT